MNARTAVHQACACRAAGSATGVTMTPKIVLLDCVKGFSVAGHDQVWRIGVKRVNKARVVGAKDAA